MTFLTADDFSTVIKAESLTKIIDDNATALSQAVDVALDEAVSYLSGRYDTAAAFTVTGEARNNILVMRLVDMALYHLYSRISPRNIPDLRRDRYLEAQELFKGVSKGTRFLQLPLLTVENQTTYYLSGSNKPFNFYF